MSKFTYSEYPNQGFWVKFDNGYRVSVQWSGVNYCSNRLKQFPSNESTTAEISVFSPSGKQQDPIGWQTPDQMLEKMQEIASINTGKRWFAFW